MRPTVVLALAAAVVAVACGEVSAAPYERVSPGELARDPARWFGQPVRFQARVSNPIDHRVWEMANGRLFVIKDDSLGRAAVRGEAMRVWGVPVPFTKRAIELRRGVNIEDHFFTDDFLADDTAVISHWVVPVRWPVPLPGWFWEWAAWYLGRGAYAEGPFRGDATRPAGAPARIPDWAWARLQPMA